MRIPNTKEAIVISLAGGIGLVLVGAVLALNTTSGGSLEIIGWGCIALGVFGLFTAIAFAVGAYHEEM